MSLPPEYFRAGVGALIVDRNGLALALERDDHPDAWQLPQGGLLKAEEPLDAAYREVAEETALPKRALELLDTYPDPLVYELPVEARKDKTGRGQVQYWFLFRLNGSDDAIDVTGGKEFRAWRWVPFDRLVETVAAFRQPVYRRLAHRFRPYLSLFLFCLALLAPAGAQAQGSPTPRWPGGQPRLGPPPGAQGYWGAASATWLVERTGAKVDVSADGLLANPGDADRVAPFQPWAKALYLQRQRARLKDDPASRCLPPGGPRQFQTPHGFQFIEQRELGRMLVLLGGGNRNWRVIYIDGRPPVPAAEAVLGYYGTSVGRWDKDTLVVESVGFNERFWLARGGLPHTEALRLVERFTRTDLRTLNYEVTIDDPGAYTRQWTAGWTNQWIPDREIQEHFCEGDAP